MRLLALAAAIALLTAAPSAAQISDVDRERLVAHLEMTARWLEDELANLSQAQLEFRRAPDTWSILENLEHLVLVGPIYWEDLQRAVRGAPTPLDLRSGDADILWYGINRSHRERALTSEAPAGTLHDAAAGLAAYRAQHARLLEYARTTKDDLRHRFVERQRCDGYQWALLISTHEQRHILQIREVKADPNFPAR